ncbi:MAG: riboflavin synthase [Planctomycetes bacterium]|nr:riboflavin synthase [Planctomycetota bacterium]
MFTGIVSLVRPLLRREQNGREQVLWIDLAPWSSDLVLGESIAVNGACLTVSARAGDLARFDLSAETLARTRLGALQPGRRVNLERALRLSDRLGGHLVSGHVDGLGRLVGRAASGGGETLSFELGAELERYLIDKGSIALDGVSLTVVAPRGPRFDVWVVPHTLRETNLGELAVGDAVHVEADLVGKWIEKLLPGAGDRPRVGLDELLRRGGYLDAERA